MVGERKKIWMIIDHPWQLMLAEAIRAGCTLPAEFHLIISKHEYWGRAEQERLKTYFHSVDFFDEPERVHSLRDIFHFIKAVRELKNRFRRLPVEKQDVLITLSYFKYVENAFTSVFAKNKQIFVCRHDMAEVMDFDLQKIRSRPENKVTKSGWMHYLFLEPLLGLKKRTIFYWIKGKELKHEMSYGRPLEKLYDEVFVCQSLTNASLKQNEIYYPYLLLRNEGRATYQKKKKIVFFLSGFVKNENYYEKISRILRNLRQRYAHEFILELRVHPGNPEEYEKIDADGWIVNSEKGLAEQYMLKHADEIQFAVSHISTALLFAFNIGLPCYSYHRCFGFAQTYYHYFDRIFEGFPDQFFMKSLDDVPSPTPLWQTFDQGAVKNSLAKLYSALQ